MSPTVDCASGVSVLADYLEGALPPAERAAVEAHVGGCERCRAFVASYRATPAIVRDATAVQVPAELERSLLDYLRRHRS